VARQTAGAAATRDEAVRPHVQCPPKVRGLLRCSSEGHSLTSIRASVYGA
jgi:hypothetical protein